MSADDQADALKGCSPQAVWSLNGGTKLKPCFDRDLLKWATAPGRVFRVYHAFLLVEPTKHTRTMRDKFKALMRELVDKRGVVIEDAYAALTTAHPGQRKAMEAMAREMIARSCQGAKSAANGERMRGRQLVVFNKEQLKDAKSIWRNVKDYPTWEDAGEALAEIRTTTGEKFTTDRAFKLWKGRK